MSRYIDADKLKEILYITANFADVKKVFERYIDRTPTEDVKPVVYGEWEKSTRKGEISWIVDEKGNKEVLEYGNIITCKCSNCGYGMGELALEYNFCPKCGADMRKEQQNDTN